ncbi:SPW repeat protein [Streptomyces sp. HMX112]|uniref:SPW repeat domain-containing protein n=1 Tax=Streptomyces sp. HMX112 TaxID=3390850 RepID=UPI003A80F7F2
MTFGSASSTSRSSPPAGSRRVLREGQREQLIGLLMLLTSVALFVAPWVVGRPDDAKDAHRNELGVGMIVLFLALARFRWHPGKWPDLIILAAGAWLIASPWVLSLQNTVIFDGAHVFDVAAGTVLMVLAALSLLLLRATRREAAREAAGDEGPGHGRRTGG